MTSAPFMQLYIADYLGDTLHLTTEQHGAYLLILMAMWRADGRLPNDPAKLARIARVSARRWHLIADDLMAFFDVDGDEITQKRLVEERQKAASISEKRSVSGKLGGDAKALKNNELALASAKQMPQHSQKPDTREEDVGAEAPTSPEPAKAAPAASRPVVELPCVSGEPFPVTEADVAEWREAFPAVDVRQQLAAMRSWLNANPTRRKTRRGMRRFVVSWLDRQQNKAPAPQATAPPRKASAFDALDEIARLKGWTSEPDGLPGNHEDAERLSAVGGGPAGASVDLRRGHDWHRGPGDH